MALADKANQFIDGQKPWVLIKEEDKLTLVHDICSVGLHLFRLIITYLKPILPTLSTTVENFLQCEPLDFANCKQTLFGHEIASFKPLLKRIEPKDIEKLIARTAEALSSEPSTKENKKTTRDNYISIDDFTKVDLRVARIEKAETVDGAEKLLRLQLNIGDESRQVFAGIKSAYKPEELEGRLTVVVANLAPRKMRFGLSEGMVIVASSSEKGLFLLSPDSGAEPGMRVK